MSDRLDQLLGELASAPGARAPDGLEAAVWSDIDARQAKATRRTSGLALQCLIGACALMLGFSVRTFQSGDFALARKREPVLQMLDRITVAEAGDFQVLKCAPAWPARWSPR